MKKILIILLAIILTCSLAFAFAGCGATFDKNSIVSQITNNLGWHEGGVETCEYEVFKDDVKLGNYTSIMQSLFNQNVEVVTSSESVKPTLNNFTGYKFTSTLSAVVDGKVLKKQTISFASHRLEPKLSYVKSEEDGKTIEIITSYAEKKSNVTFIQDGIVTSDSAKYSKSAFVVDNSFLYQFARATTLSAAISIVVPTYDANAHDTQNTSFTCSYSSASNIVLANRFVLEKSFSQTIIASGDVSGDTTEETSGSPITNPNEGYIDSGETPTSTEDASGNVTISYKKVLTNSIPVVKCTFTTAKTFPASGSISCMIATAPMKMQGDSKFANRVVARFQEGGFSFNLTSVTYKM